MPRARKPFKSFNRNQYIFAVQLTEENIDDVAQRIGGRVRETEDGLVMKLGDATVTVGQYVVVTDIVDEQYRYGVMGPKEFEEDWVVPKAATTNEEVQTNE